MNTPDESSIQTAAAGKRVLILTASIGAGHNSAARAVAMELTARRPDLDVQVVDILDHAKAFFRLYYAGGFVLSMTRLPWAYGLGFWLSNRPHRPGRSPGEHVRMAWERWMLSGLSRMLVETQPDLIVNTHFAQQPLIRRLQQKGLLRCPQLAVITDVEMHRWWYARDVAAWMAPSEYTAAGLRRWGVDPSTIHVTGIPLHPKWDKPVDREKALREWNLPADKQIVVLSGGAEFTCGPIAKLARAIVQTRDDAFVVALAGRNKKLLAQLSQLAASHDRICPLGFTERINELVNVASLMVTKPGGITTTECLAAGTPMLLSNPVPGQEGGNARYYANQGAAVIARGTRSIIRTVCDLLADRPRLDRMAETARQLHRPGRQTDGDIICAALDRL